MPKDDELANRDPHPELAPAHWHSIDYESARALAETNFVGDNRYGYDNWRKGLPASSLIDHAMEHLFKMLEGDTAEPHLEHAMWNLGKLRWMARNKPELIDVPRIRMALGMPPLEEGKDERHKDSTGHKHVRRQVGNHHTGKGRR